ncbi:MAG: DUF4917 family protein [Gammaproteobacteria bacterium AqS3]|nr:DUF4917 family protein [Gammaproteobacteria bacterium AqS3]
MTKIISYADLIDALNNSSADKHLLTGNGFNKSLNIYTDYKNIYRAMSTLWPQYDNIKDIFESTHINYDIEKVIDILNTKLELNGEDDKEILLNFTKESVNEKMRIDFLIALYKIVDFEKSKIYDSKKQHGIKNFMSIFDSYFTLNFDPLLYLILMWLKNKNKKTKPQQQDLPNFQDFNSNQFQKIKEIYHSSILKLDQIDSLKDSMSNSTLERFLINSIQAESEFSDWKIGLIKLAVKKIKDDFNKSNADIDTTSPDRIEENSKLRDIEIFDGFTDEIDEKFFFDKHCQAQNLFFLHGGIHIVMEQIQNKNRARKITKRKKKNSKSFYSNLDEVVHYQGVNITCILSGSSKYKLKKIHENQYLCRCYKALGHISGDIVVSGCSFSENDSHIYKHLDRDTIETLYISTSVCDLKNGFADDVNDRLPNNKGKVVFYDYKDVSYEADLPNNTLPIGHPERT